MKVWHVKLQKGPCKNIVWLIMNRCYKKKIPWVMLRFRKYKWVRDLTR